MPTPKKVFRGLIPSESYFELTPSFYENFDSGIDLTGYHVSSSGSPLIGSEYPTNELAISYDLYLKVVIEKNSNCLITQRSSKQTILVLISALLGSVFGLMGSIGGAMKFLESKIDIVKNILKKKEDNQKLMKDGEFLGNLLDENKIKSSAKSSLSDFKSDREGLTYD